MAKRTNYDRGREIEYKAVHELKDKGYFNPVRTAGSHGMFDVIAFKSDRVLLVQVKRSKTAITFEQLYKEDLDEMIQVLPLLSVDVQIEAWVWVDRKGWTQKLLIKPAGFKVSPTTQKMIEKTLKAGKSPYWACQDPMKE